MKEGCLFVLFQWFMKHISLGYLKCVVLPLPIVLALQSEMLLLLIMMTHNHSWNQTSHKSTMHITLQM
jgi:hypothetical protein